MCVRGCVQAQAEEMVRVCGAPPEVEVGDLGQEGAALGEEQASVLRTRSNGYKEVKEMKFTGLQGN